MRVLAINGSPRKTWNTATLLQKALEGASSQGAETELIHLTDLNFRGCKSCFQCKLKNGENYRRCAVQDDLTPVFEKIRQVDALILGSPVYESSVTGDMACFLERLFFAWMSYEIEIPSYFDKIIKTAFIYTMSMDPKNAELYGYHQHFGLNTMVMSKIFGSSEALFVYDTLLCDDYSKYAIDYVDTNTKAKSRAEVFPLDCQKAFQIGVKFSERQSGA